MERKRGLKGQNWGWELGLGLGQQAPSYTGSGKALYRLRGGVRSVTQIRL